MSNQIFNKEDFDRLEATLSMDSGRKYYVYMLTTQEGIPIYIGKGQGTRLFQHEEDAKAALEEDGFDINEAGKIAAILKEYEQDKSITKVIVKWGLTNDEAYMCESALINLYNHLKDAYPKGNLKDLKNVVNGHASPPEGYTTKARTIEEFMKDVAVKPQKIGDLLTDEDKNHSIVFIKISGTVHQYKGANRNASVEDFIYDCVRGFWRMGREPEYVVALGPNRVVVGVYKVKGWKTLSENVSEYGSDMPEYPLEARAEDKKKIENNYKESNLKGRKYFVKDDDIELTDFYFKLKDALKGVMLTDEKLKGRSEYVYWPW